MDMITLGILAGFCGLIFLLYKLQYPKNHAEMDLMPGPSRRPILGCDLPGPTKDQTEWFIAQSERHKKGYFGFKVLNLYAIVTYKAEFVEVILSDTTNIKKGFPYDFVHDWFGQALLTSTGNDWHRQRKLLTPTFHFKILNDFLLTMNEQTAVLIDILKGECKKAGGQASLDICPYLTLCTLDTICETSMGKALGAQTSPRHPYAVAMQVTQTTFCSCVLERYVRDTGMMCVISFPASSLLVFADAAVERLGTPYMWNNTIFKMTALGKAYWNSLKVMKDFTAEVIRDREENPYEEAAYESDSGSSNKKRLVFLDLVLAMKREGSLSVKEVQEQVDTFMFAGHDTTATSLMWALYCMGKHPDIQQKAQQEIDEVMGGRSDLTNTDLNNLKYLDRCMKESQRLYSTVPMIARELTKPIVIVNVCMWQLHRDPEQFPDPMKFDPDRFLPEVAEKRHKFAYVPFSAGLRNCIGQKFAQMEDRVILASVLRNFSIESLQEEKEVQPLFKFVSVPENGILLKLTPRD